MRFSVRLTGVLAVALIACFATASPASADTLTWAGPTTGLWDDPASWSPPAIPGPADDVVIDVAGSYEVELIGGPFEVASLTLASSGATLRVDGSLTVSGSLSLSAGAIDGVGLVAVDGSFDWSGGALRGIGSLNANAGATLSSSGTKTLDTRRLTTAGIVDWQDGSIASSGAARWTVAQGSSLESSGGVTWTDDGTGALVLGGGFTHTGTLKTDLGIRVQSTVSGNVTANGGTLSFTAGGILAGSMRGNGTIIIIRDIFDVEPSAALIGGGAVVVSQGATLNLRSDVGMDGGVIRLDAGTLAPDSGIAFSPLSTLEVRGGTVSFPGGGLTPTLVPTLSQTGGLVSVSGDLDVSSQYTLEGGSVAADGQLTTANLSQTGGHVVVSGSLDVTGTHAWDAGTLDLNPGGASVVSTIQTGGDLLGRGTLWGCGGVWSGGSWRGVGTTILTGSLDMNGVGSRTLESRRVIAQAPVTWSSGDIDSSGAASWSQEAGHELNISSDGLWSSDGTDELVVRGTLRKSTSSTAGIDAPLSLESTGLLLVDGGTLDLGGGALFSRASIITGTICTGNGLYEFTPASQVQGTGAVVVGPGAIVDMGTNVQMDGGGRVIIDGGTFDVDAGLSFSQGASLQVRSGAATFPLADPPATTLVPTLSQTGGLVRVSGDLNVSSQYTLDAGSVSAEGLLTTASLNQSGGYVGVAGSLDVTGIHTWDAGTLDLNPGGASVASTMQAGGDLLGRGTLWGGGGVWSGGSWRGVGTTVLTGSLDMNGIGPKRLASRQVVTEADVTWSEGDIDASGGARWTQGAGTTLSIASTGSWLSDGTDRIVAAGTVRPNGGTFCCLDGVLQVTPSGLLDVPAATSFETRGGLDVSGRLVVGGTLVMNDATLSCGGGGPGCPASLFVDMGTVSLDGVLSHDLVDPTAWTWVGASNLFVRGGAGAAIGDWDDWAKLEVAGEDLGPGAGFVGNFELQELELATDARLLLEDLLDNGQPDAEALYVDTLTLSSGALLNVNGLSLYYANLVGDPSQIIDVPIIGVAVDRDEAQGGVRVSWTNGVPPFRVLRSTSPSSGFVEITPPGGTFDFFHVDPGALFDGVDYYYRVEEHP